MVDIDNISNCFSNLYICAVLAFLFFIKHIFRLISVKENYTMARTTDSENDITC